MSSSSAAAAATPRVPPFRKNIVPIDPIRHGALKLNRNTGYRYSTIKHVI